jgi:hypothetical protein
MNVLPWQNFFTPFCCKKVEPKSRKNIVQFFVGVCELISGKIIINYYGMMWYPKQPENVQLEKSTRAT